MPAEIKPASVATPAAVRAVVSAPTELYCALYMVGLLFQRPPDRAQWVDGYAKRNPALVERIRSRYQGSGPTCAPEGQCWEPVELLVYALRSDTFFDTDLARFFARMEAAAAVDEGELPLASEVPEVEAMVNARLALLSGSAEERTESRELLEEFWAGLQPEWEGGGREVAENAARSLRERLERGEDLRSLIPNYHLALRERFWPLVEQARARRECIITPLYFGGEGQHIVAIPGLLSIGFGLDVDRRAGRIREQAEAAAGRYKVLSDPTRASLISFLQKGPQSITDLATILGLAQPTVSVHMKQLREAGLLESEKSGNSTLYSAPPEKVRRFLEEAERDLLRK